MNDHHLIPLSLDSSDAGFGLSFFLDEIVIPKRKKKKEEEFFLSSHSNIKETEGQRGRMFCLDSSLPLWRHFGAQMDILGWLPLEL